jgi:hypothetical protein
MQPQPASRELESYFVTKWREGKIKYGGSERYGGNKRFLAGTQKIWRERIASLAAAFIPFALPIIIIFQKSHIARRKYRSLYNTTIN